MRDPVVKIDDGRRLESRIHTVQCTLRFTNCELVNLYESQLSYFEFSITAIHNARDTVFTLLNRFQTNCLKHFFKLNAP